MCCRSLWATLFLVIGAWHATENVTTISVLRGSGGVVGDDGDDDKLPHSAFPPPFA